MSKNREPAILDHEYDGIREYDNPTPSWWHAIFLTTIVFAFFYITFWHFSPLAWTIQESFEQDQVADYKRLFGTVGDLKADEATILTMMGDQKMLGVAQSLFVGNCSVCHGKEGSGINGVNLTDDSYKNVKKIEDIYATISKGANLGAMPSWEQRLSKNERVILAAFVATLRGKNIPGRAPEGDKIDPWPPIPPPAPAKAPSK